MKEKTMHKRKGRESKATRQEKALARLKKIKEPTAEQRREIQALESRLRRDQMGWS